MTKSDNLTPAQLTALLQVSDRTVRRLAEAYEGVYSRLPTSKRKTRLFPPVAVERITDAYATLRAAPGMSATEVFTHQRDGLPVRTRERVTPDVLAPVMDELRALRSEVAALRELLTSGQGAVSHDSTPPALALHSDPGPVTPQPPKRLQPNHQNLVDALEQGHVLRVRPGGRTGETAELYDQQGGLVRQIDPRTIDALVRYGLLEREGDGYRLTTDPLLTGG